MYIINFLSLQWLLITRPCYFYWTKKTRRMLFLEAKDMVWNFVHFVMQLGYSLRFLASFILNILLQQWLDGLNELNNYVVKLILQQLINSFDLQLLLLLCLRLLEKHWVKEWKSVNATGIPNGIQSKADAYPRLTRIKAIVFPEAEVWSSIGRLLSLRRRITSSLRDGSTILR